MPNSNNETKEKNKLTLSCTFESCDPKVYSYIQTTRRRTIVDLAMRGLSKYVPPLRFTLGREQE